MLIKRGYKKGYIDNSRERGGNPYVLTMSIGLFSVYKISGYAFSDLSIILLL
jgi:hypothetical protein